MMRTTFMSVLFLLLVASCSESKKETSNNSSSANPLNCSQYPWMMGCSGGGNVCTTQYPPPPGCGTTTGSTAGGTTTGGSSGNPYGPIPSDNNWQSLYPQGVPAGSCSSTTGSGYEPRQATITLAGNMPYNPANPWSSMGDSQYSSIRYSHNNSYFLTDTAQAKAFFDSDAKLKVRFKVRPQPAVSKSQGTWCLGRATGQAADTYGYKSLKLGVSLAQLNADGSVGTWISTQYVSAGVNSCTPAIDFSGLAQSAPHGVVVTVHSVQSDQGCWYGSNCNAYVAVRTASCWQVDFQVSVDGTKDFQ